MLLLVLFCAKSSEREEEVTAENMRYFVEVSGDSEETGRSYEQEEFAVDDDVVVVRGIVFTGKIETGAMDGWDDGM